MAEGESLPTVFTAVYSQSTLYDLYKKEPGIILQPAKLILGLSRK